MTTMALTSAPLRRLFDRLDFAPRPREAVLEAFLGAWDRLRASQIAPRQPFAADALGPEASLFVRAEQGHDYVVTRTSRALEGLLGAVVSGELLSAASRRRRAVQLRRLIDLAIEKGEPTLASFACEAGVVVEAIAAPIMQADGRVDSAAFVHHVRRMAPMLAHLPLARPDRAGPLLFALGGSRALAVDVAQRLGVEVAPHEERDFEDGEHKIRPLTSVRNQDVYVLAGLATSPGQSVNDKLCKLLFFVGALAQSAARRVTVVAPYLCYSRKERQTKPRDPVVTRHLAQMLEAVGVDRVVTVTAHDLAAFQNAFRCETEHLDVYALFAHTLSRSLIGRPVTVVSPDPGGEKRAELFRRTLEPALQAPVGKALVDKTRSMGEVSGELFAGDVTGRTALIVDDMISTGGTMMRAAAMCRARGATHVLAVATHGLFTGGAQAFLRSDSIDEIWITDSLPVSTSLADAVRDARVRTVSIAPLLAGAIERCHAGGSINELLEHELSPQPGSFSG
jgi:ribose-phosphate pyrophosphokinase